MECLIFDGLVKALAANDTISLNAGYAVKDTVTKMWAAPLMRATDGKWWFYKPSEPYMMVNVIYDSIEEYDPSWEPD